MKNAAIYCRVSTEDQEREGTSLHTQLEACLVKSKELGYEAPEQYNFSETWPGADTDRPKLNELRKLIKNRLVDAVICFSTDRLARNPIHIAIIAEECDRQEVELIFVTEPLDNSAEGQLIRYVKGYAAQVEREKIRERTMRGKKAKAREGKLSTGGTSPFGYYYVGGKREINLDEAEIVKSIFEKVAREKYTLYRLECELNEAGIGAPRHGKWTVNKISRLLSNPAYKGETYAFRYKAVEPKNPVKRRPYTKTTVKERDRADWIEIPNATPPIVSGELFEMAQKVLSDNKTHSRRNRKYDYMFSRGRIRCGVCGYSMVGCSAGYGKRLYYRCARNVRKRLYGGCDQPAITANSIENQVWAEIAAILKNPDIVLSELERQRTEAVPATIEADEILVSKNIEDAKDEEQRYLRQYGRGKLSELLLDQEIDRVRRYRTTQEEKLAQLREQKRDLEAANVQFEKISNVLKMLDDKLGNADYELKQLALEALDIKVKAYPSGEIEISGIIPSEVELHPAKSPRWLFH